MASVPRSKPQHGRAGMRQLCCSQQMNVGAVIRRGIAKVHLPCRQCRTSRTHRCSQSHHTARSNGCRCASPGTHHQNRARWNPRLSSSRLPCHANHQRNHKARHGPPAHLAQAGKNTFTCRFRKSANNPRHRNHCTTPESTKANLCVHSQVRTAQSKAMDDRNNNRHLDFFLAQRPLNSITPNQADSQLTASPRSQEGKQHRRL